VMLWSAIMVNNLCLIDCIEVEEQKCWKELPATWSVPKPGERCQMTKLLPFDPEYMEVECNVRKTCSKSQIEIVSVSKTCETSVHSLCHSNILFLCPAET